MTKCHIALLAAALSCLSAYAQTPAQPAKPAPSTKAPQPNATELKVEISLLEARVRMLERGVAPEMMRLDCNSKSFMDFRLEDSTLVFLASCDDIVPYLEGHKVTISIGNPYFFEFHDLSGTMTYSKTPAVTDWKDVPISTTTSLKPGSWTSITVTINPSKAEDLHNIYITLGAKQAGPP